jgi:hypothetical protein
MDHSLFWAAAARRVQPSIIHRSGRSDRGLDHGSFAVLSRFGSARLERILEVTDGLLELVAAARIAEAHDGAVVEGERIRRDRLSRPRAGLVDGILTAKRLVHGFIQ